jgi:hypothetical protein
MQTTSVVVLGPSVQARVRRLVAALKVDGAASALGIGRSTLLRIISGLGVRRGSAHLALAALGRLEGSDSSPPRAA